jgi:hypothetical protein
METQMILGTTRRTRKIVSQRLGVTFIEIKIARMENLSEEESK